MESALVFTLFAILFRLIFLALKLAIHLVKWSFKVLWFILKHLGMGLRPHRPKTI